MNNIQKLIMFFLFYVFYLKNSFNAALKQKSKHLYFKNNSNVNFSQKNIKNIFSRRNLQDTLRKEEELPFRPLSIYIDTAEFNETFPEDLEEYKDNYLIAMNRAKNILEDFLEINTDINGNKSIKYPKIKYINFYYGITNFTEIFSENFLKVDVYNYYIFGKFTNELNEESASVILDDFSEIPFVGIILFNNNTKNLDNSKLNLNYLTNLMLHHFIRLLGF